MCFMIVFCCTWQKGDTHGKCVFAHIINLFGCQVKCLYTCLVRRNLLHNQLPTNECLFDISILLAIYIYPAFLSLMYMPGRSFCCHGFTFCSLTIYQLCVRCALKIQLVFWCEYLCSFVWFELANTSLDILRYVRFYMLNYSPLRTAF
jgi:hypothetical protein